jgi:hypothetical protein
VSDFLSPELTSCAVERNSEESQQEACYGTASIHQTENIDPELYVLPTDINKTCIFFFLKGTVK